MREVAAVNKRRRLLEEVKALLEPGPGVEGEAAPETADLRDADGNMGWVWGVSRFGGPGEERVRADVFGG